MANSENIPTKSDQEIYTLALQEWIGILTKLWTAFGKEVNKAQIKVYKDALGDLPLGILESVVEETIRRHKYNSVPTLGEVQDVLDDLHPYWQGEDHIHTRPNREASNQQRLVDGTPEYSVDYPEAVEMPAEVNA
jgi:hypothetical protein